MYEYTASDSGIRMNGETDFTGELELFLPIPENAEVLDVHLNGIKTDYQLHRERNADYVQISRKVPGEFRISVAFASDAE